MGVGRPPGSPNKITQEARDICKGLLEHPDVRKRYQGQLKDGTLHPQLETLMWHYAYGVPKQAVVHEGSGENPLEVILSWQPLPHHDKDSA